MIYDSSYTDAEYPRYRGWGHSTWQEGVRIADAAGVGTLAIFHHDPATTTPSWTAWRARRRRRDPAPRRAACRARSSPTKG